MPVLVTLIEGAVGWAGGRVADTVGGKLIARLKERGAKRELAEIIERAIGSAVEIAPSLADDLRSGSFLQHVLAPMVLRFMCDPTSELNEAAIADGYIETFVVPFLNGRSTDETLVIVFRTERENLHRAFEKFLKRLRLECYASQHWKDQIRDLALEDVRSSVFRIEKLIAPVSPSDAVDLDVARRDAETGSEALKSWTKTISGQHIERPELGQLIQRVRDHPFGSTLVIGEAGSGKSALFAELVSNFQSQGMVVFAIKADLLPTSVRTLTDVSAALGLRGQILQETEVLARVAPVDFDSSPLEAANAVFKIIAVVNEWQSHFLSVGVTEPDITEIAALVDTPDLLAQRQSFSADAYAQAGKPRRKRSPGAKAFR